MAAGEHHKRASFRIPRVSIKGDGHRVLGRTDDFFTPKRTCLRTISSWCVDNVYCTTCRHASCSRLMELFARADSTYSLSHSRPTEDSAKAIRTSSYSSAPNVVSVHKSTSGVAPVKPHSCCYQQGASRQQYQHTYGDHEIQVASSLCIQMRKSDLAIVYKSGSLHPELPSKQTDAGGSCVISAIPRKVFPTCDLGRGVIAFYFPMCLAVRTLHAPRLDQMWRVVRRSSRFSNLTRLGSLEAAERRFCPSMRIRGVSRTRD